MPAIFQFVVILNALFFLFYGFQSLNSQVMIDEFKRFGMTDKMRQLTGILQISGSAGLFAGFMFSYAGFLAAAGFTIMMIVAFIIRIKIKDSFIQSLPSLFFMLVNTWLTISFYNLL
ncbi:MAG: DoxX family protein [Balneolaceae bacterium]|nr:DoxX family protein [Balneolaceae bacterium]